jgi:hypothetical protein
LRPELRALTIGGPRAPWDSLGLAAPAMGGVALRFNEVAPPGIRGWVLHGLAADADLDGLPTTVTGAPPATAPRSAHPLGVVAIDHVVAVTPDVERTAARLAAAGLDRRRSRRAGDVTQVFFVLGPCLLELAGPSDDAAPRFWGLTLVVEDLDAAAERLGDDLGAIRDAVQPGRRIATVRRRAGLGVPLALMTPRH